MPSARIDYDRGLQAVVLSGDIVQLARDPLFVAYLRSVKGAATGSQFQIPTEEIALSRRIQDLGKLLARLGLTLDHSENGEADSALLQAEQSERLFAEFSTKADAIWHGGIESQGLSDFVRAIASSITGRTLYRRQLLSAYHLAFAQHACNFSVPGAGKTSIVYAAFAYLNSLSPDDPKHVDRLMVVGPLSSFKAWEDEYQALFSKKAHSRRIAGFTSPEVRRRYLRGIDYADRETLLTLTTYATLAGAEDDFRHFLARDDRRTMMVVDEAHNIKREDGYWSSAALGLAPHAASRVVLTGTPAANGYEDLNNLFRFIYPERNVIGFSIGMLKAMSAGTMTVAVENLKAKIRPFYTRIRKADLGLPPARELDTTVSLSAPHREIYNPIERSLIPQLRAALQTGRSSLITARLIRLRQAAVNPALLVRPLSEEGLIGDELDDTFSIGEIEVADRIARFDPLRDLSRLHLTRDLARQVVETEGKVVVWSYFLGNLALLREVLRPLAQYVEVITGSTPVDLGEDALSSEGLMDLQTREKIIDRFHRVGETAILIANPQAVGESISLHKAARTAIYFDRDFNAGRYIQSKDRIHRYNPHPIGDVTYHLVRAANTVDDTIDARLRVKEQRLVALMDSEEIPLFGAADRDDAGDIRAILEDYERRKTV